jgi:hypothetical protein
MAEEIINRVTQSSLITIDLEDFYPEGPRISINLKDWLYEGLILREKDFRDAVKTHDWSSYQDSFVSIYCSSDAIIPAWANLLITLHLEPFAKYIVFGTRENLETAIYQDIINKLDTSIYENKPIIVKGCSNKSIPSNAYIQLVKKLKPVARSIMYGEACSSVPLFKKAK